MTTNDAQIAREWAERAVESAENAQPVSEGALAAARHILATTTLPTMADVEWDDEVHAGLCAEHAGGEVVRMVNATISTTWIRYILPNGEISGGSSKLLTPIPGTKINLTPRREPEPESTPESTPEPEQESTPEPEDVKPDPQPGEAWLIEYEGKRYEAIYWYSPLYAHWVFVRDREGACSIESHEATPVSRLARKSTPEHPEVLATQEDYESAPEGTIVANDLSDPWVKDSMGFWLVCGEGGGEISRLMALSSRRVLRWGETL